MLLLLDSKGRDVEWIRVSSRSRTSVLGSKWNGVFRAAVATGVDERDGVEASAPCRDVDGDNKFREGNDDSGGVSYGTGALVGDRTVDMYKGRFELDDEGCVDVEVVVDCSSDVSSSLLSFSTMVVPSSTATSLLLMRPVRPLREIQAARSVFHANTRTRTTNVWCRNASRRLTTGEVSRDTDATATGDVACAR